MNIDASDTKNEISVLGYLNLMITIMLFVL